MWSVVWRGLFKIYSLMLSVTWMLFKINFFTIRFLNNILVKWRLDFYKGFELEMFCENMKFWKSASSSIFIFLLWFSKHIILSFECIKMSRKYFWAQNALQQKWGNFPFANWNGICWGLPLQLAQLIKIHFLPHLKSFMWEQKLKN